MVASRIGNGLLSCSGHGNVGFPHEKHVYNIFVGHRLLFVILIQRVRFSYELHITPFRYRWELTSPVNERVVKDYRDFNHPQMWNWVHLVRRRFTCNDNHNNSDHTSQKDKLVFIATKRRIKTMMYRLKPQVKWIFLRDYIFSPLNSSFFVVLGQMLEGCWAQFARVEVLNVITVLNVIKS